MDILPPDNLLYAILGWSLIAITIAITMLFVAVVETVSHRVSFNRSTSVEGRREAYGSLRKARILRCIALEVLSVALLFLAIGYDMSTQHNIVAMVNQSSYSWGTRFNSSDYISLMGQVAALWVAFGIAFTLTVVQILAHPWRSYEETIKGTNDLADADYDRQRKRIKKLKRQLKALRKQHASEAKPEQENAHEAAGEGER